MCYGGRSAGRSAAPHGLYRVLVWLAWRSLRGRSSRGMLHGGEGAGERGGEATVRVLGCRECRVSCTEGGCVVPQAVDEARRREQQQQRLDAAAAAAQQQQAAAAAAAPAPAKAAQAAAPPPRKRVPAARPPPPAADDDVLDLISSSEEEEEAEVEEEEEVGGRGSARLGWEKGASRQRRSGIRAVGGSARRRLG